jgi:hypothetical protein
LPVVLTRQEAHAALSNRDGVPLLVSSLLLRVRSPASRMPPSEDQGLDLARRSVTVRQGKCARDRNTILPERWWSLSRAISRGPSDPPSRPGNRIRGDRPAVRALDRKYPEAPRGWKWARRHAPYRAFRRLPDPTRVTSPLCRSHSRSYREFLAGPPTSRNAPLAQAHFNARYYAPNRPRLP